MTRAPRRTPIGTHLPVSGGLRRALLVAGEVGAEVVQVFASNPRGWSIPPVDAAGDAAFRDEAQSVAIPVFVHAPYLVNLGSPTPLTVERSATAVAYGLRRGAALGARGLVVHTGSCVTDGSYDLGMRQVRESLLPLLDGLPDDAPDLLLEPTAGQGHSLCATVDDLEAFLATLDHHPRARVCLDTCHAFAAGHDLAAPGGAKTLLDRVVEVGGSGRLGLVHANDSKAACGSAHDRHERVGRGRIGLDAFADLLTHPAVVGVPVVLETPGGPAAYAEDIALLKSLRPA